MALDYNLWTENEVGTDKPLFMWETVRIGDESTDYEDTVLESGIAHSKEEAMSAIKESLRKQK